MNPRTESMSENTTTHLAPAITPARTGSDAATAASAPGNPSDVMLNKRELAERLKVTVRTVENRQQRGVLPYVKIGKVVIFHWPEVVEFLKSNFRVCRRTINN